METSADTLYQTSGPAENQRPEFLKILCILSFIACGLMILIYAMGSMTLSLGQASIDEIWPQVVKSYPQFEEVDGVEFFQNVGRICLYGLFANIFSLIGVIMMWRMEKFGFYIYAVAELVTNFFSLNMERANRNLLIWVWFFQLRSILPLLLCIF